MSNKFHTNTKTVFKRELQRMISRPIYLLASVGVMLFCFIFFLTFFKEGMPRKLPIGVVDQDNSYISRTLTHNVDALPQLNVYKHYPNHEEARKDMQRGKIYAFVSIGKNFEADLLASRRPQVEFYVNETYLIAGSLAYKDLTYIGELGSGYFQQRLMQARGVVGDENIMPVLQPIAVDSHSLGNPYTNYGIYLLNLLLPGVLQLSILMLTVFAIGIEIKQHTQGEWYAASGHSITAALIGKLLPYTIIFIILGITSNLLLYSYMHFTMNGKIWRMFLATIVYVLAYQSIGVFIIGLFSRLRDAISLSAFYGLFAFTFAGFTFPIEAMPYKAQIFNYLFPIRYYFKIYVREALYGAPVNYSLIYFAAMSVFLLLPFIVIRSLKNNLEKETEVQVYA